MIGDDFNLEKTIDMSCIKQSIINHAIEVIVKRTLEIWPEKPDAIILCGGYGRGEGAWITDDQGQIHPYNDFDIIIVSDYSIDHKELADLRKRLANEVDVNWVDIDIYSKNRLAQLKPSIKNYDLLHASKIIYGDLSVLDTAPKFEHYDIGISDIVQLYLTRMWTFLGGWKGDFRDLDSEESLFFRYQLAKAVLAACDAVLVSSRQYTSSYIERARLVCEISSDDENVQECVKWAISQKICPSNRPLSKEEMIRLYNNSLYIFKWGFEIGLGRDKKYFFDPNKTWKYFAFRTSTGAKTAAVFSLRGNLRPLRALVISLAQNFVLNAYLDRGHLNPYMETAQRLLKKVKYDVPNELSWHVLKDIVAEARLKG